MSQAKGLRSEVFGQIIQKPMPQGKLVSTMNLVVKKKKIAWAFPELRCIFGDRSIIRDIAVFLWSRIPCDENGEMELCFLGVR